MTGETSGRHPVNCRRCRHFYITHEPKYPYGCRAIGFKSRETPSAVVRRDSGKPCMMFSPKTKTG